MKHRQFLMFALTSVLDIIVGVITLEVLGMVYMSAMPIESVITIVLVVPFITIAEYVISKLKDNEELI